MPEEFISLKENGKIHFKITNNYEKNKLTNKTMNFSDKLIFVKNYKHNTENQVVSYNNPFLSKSFSHDKYGRIIKESIVQSNFEKTLNYTYSKGQILSGIKMNCGPLMELSSTMVLISSL